MNITLTNICKKYGSEKVFQDLNATIPEGSLLSVLGVNGAGKTTLLRMLASVSGRDSGDILFDEKSARRDDMEQRRELCFLPDFPVFFEDKSLLENICVSIKLWQRPDPDEAHVMDILEEFDLLKHACKPSQALSRGQRYKAALISLLLIDPALWLLDEPFASGMDPRGLSLFKRYSQDAVTRGKTVIYTTQLVDLAKTFSSEIWILGDQGILARGSANEIDWEQEQLLHIQ